MTKRVGVYDDYSSGVGLALATSMLMLGSMAYRKSRAEEFKNLSPEEQQKVIEEKQEEERRAQERKERRRVEWFIHQGKCPYCGKKLIRGKKSKENGYKRTWKCVNCNIELS
jgi:predicted RNA-binding Zn-ribbon protein involved in translation (DUF1610 family)